MIILETSYSVDKEMTWLINPTYKTRRKFRDTFRVQWSNWMGKEIR